MKSTELVRLLEQSGFRVVKEKGSTRYYGKIGLDKLIWIDYHSSEEVRANHGISVDGWHVR